MGAKKRVKKDFKVGDIVRSVVNKVYRGTYTVVGVRKATVDVVLTGDETSPIYDHESKDIFKHA